MAVLGNGVAAGAAIRVGPRRARPKLRRARPKLRGHGWTDVADRIWSRRVWLASLPLAESLVSHCSACLHEPVVGSVRRLQDCLRWLVPICRANRVHLVRCRDHPLLDQGASPLTTVASSKV